MSEEAPEDVDILRRLSIFGALRPSTIEFLRDRCECVRRAPGELYFKQGELGDAVFVLRRGRVAVEREHDDERVVFAELEAGHCFGEVALVAIQPRTATVRAVDACSALRLRNEAIHDLYRHDLEQFAILQMNLGREVARRLAQADEALFAYALRCGEGESRPRIRDAGDSERAREE